MLDTSPCSEVSFLSVAESTGCRPSRTSTLEGHRRGRGYYWPCTRDPESYMTTVVILEIGDMREIQLRDAKASLSAVIDEAMRGKPAVITRHGKREAVILSFKEWERLSQ